MAVLGSSAQAGFIQFSPTGSGPEYTIGGIDVAPGNALAVNAVPLSVGSTFQLDYQAAVGGLINTSGLTFAPPGLNSTYQLTAVGSFTEVVTSLFANGTVATFAQTPTQSPNSFFEIYYNPAVVANSLAGTGFNVGTLVLHTGPNATLASVGIFSHSTDSTGAPVKVPFDQYLTNNYPGVTTVAGSGATLSYSNISYFNPAFFKTEVERMAFNTSIITPFNQVNPSALFVGSPGGAPPNVVPNIGAINGISGPDFQFQADANLSFTIPEPDSIIPASLGMLATLGLAAWMRR
jgi:hypothetical protein